MYKLVIDYTWHTPSTDPDLPTDAFQLIVTGQHAVTRCQTHSDKREKRPGVAIHELSGCAPTQVGRQRIGHAAQQAVDERPSGEVPSVLPAGTRWAAVAYDGIIQRSSVDAPRRRPGTHHQTDITVGIGTAEAQPRRTIPVKYVDR